MRPVLPFITRTRISPPGFLVSLVLIFLFFVSLHAQTGGGHTLYGDLKVDESKITGLKPMSFEVVLFSRNGSVLGRQTVPKNGRFRFENLSNGTFFIIVMLDNAEISTSRITLSSAINTDYRNDVFLEWRPGPSGKKEEKSGVVSSTNRYERSAAGESGFLKAEEAIKRKDYDQAKTLLRQIVREDPKDFEAWTELGTVYFLQKNNDEAEKSYLQALDKQPLFILALVNLGKVRLAQKNYEGAIQILTRAIAVKPPSVEANYFLGEAYLNIGKGSKAVDYMNEALRLEPVTRAEIHLRIAAIYDSVGLKDLAAREYETFLQKRSNYAEKKKLQKYIAEHKKL
jgi:tetratricopeptide (TPR) repeat protein